MTPKRIEEHSSGHWRPVADLEPRDVEFHVDVDPDAIAAGVAARICPTVAGSIDLLDGAVRVTRVGLPVDNVLIPYSGPRPAEDAV